MEFVRRYPTAAYIVLTYAFSWTCWSVFQRKYLDGNVWALPGLMLGLFGPGLIGILRSFLSFGAFASADGTAMAALTHFPQGWSQRGQTLFWGYASMIVFLAAILMSGVVYSLIERLMKAVAVITVCGVTLCAPSTTGITYCTSLFERVYTLVL